MRAIGKNIYDYVYFYVDNVCIIVYIILINNGENEMPKRYSSAELIKIVLADGWYEVSCNGSHHKFKHPSKKGIVVIPHPKKEMPIGTAEKILKMAGIK